MVRQWQDMFFEERFSQVRLTHGLPDYAQLARAYGALGFTVESEDELEDALAAALASGRTAVVDARVDQSEHCFPMIPSGAAAPPSARADLMALGEVFDARIADLGPDAIVFELTGSPEDVESFEELIRPHGLQELVRTGRIGLARAHRPDRNRTRQHVLA